jgi:hypothetical protein
MRSTALIFVSLQSATKQPFHAILAVTRRSKHTAAGFSTAVVSAVHLSTPSIPGMHYRWCAEGWHHLAL